MAAAVVGGQSQSAAAGGVEALGGVGTVCSDCGGGTVPLVVLYQLIGEAVNQMTAAGVECRSGQSGVVVR